MSALDRLLEGNGLSVDGNHSWIDADTLVDKEGNSFRLQGYDAPEISKYNESGKQWSSATAGSGAATPAIIELARKQGFNNVVKLEGTDATGQRGMVDLRDDKGRSFTTELLKSGALEAGEYTSKEDLEAIAVADLFRDRADPNSEFGKSAAEITEAIAAQSSQDLNFKKQALNESWLANGQGQFAKGGVQFRDYDRSLSNKSNNPLSDSWHQGWTGVSEAAYGVLDLVGDRAGIDSLKDIGEAGINRARTRLSDYGTTLTSYKDVDGFGTAMQFLGNNLALSLPYMAITTGATLAAAPTFGASFAAPVSIYTGQVWNEMEGEKSATVAIGAGILQAGLDTLGFKGAVKVGSMKSMWNGAVDQLVKSGVSRDVAERQLANATRREMATLSGDAANVAKQQLGAKQTFQDLVQRSIMAGGFEGSTEGLQEATAYLAATSGSDKHFDGEELKERLIAGAVAGTSLGSAFGVAGKAHDYGAWADVAYRLAPADAKFDSLNAQFAAEEKNVYGRVASVEELAADARARATSRIGATLEDRANADRTRRSSQSTLDEVTERGLNLSSLWQGSTRNIFHPELQRRSRSARILADMFGGNLQRTFSGAGFENSKHHRVAIYKNLVPIPETVWAALRPGKRMWVPDKIEASNEIYEQLNAAVDKDGKFDPRLVPEGPAAAVIRKLGDDLNILSNRMHGDQAKYNPDLGFINNYLFKYKSISKKAVEQNAVAFQQLLQKEYKYSPDEAKKLTDTIRDNPEVNNIEEAFSVVKGGIVPGSHRKRTLNMSENQAFKDFMEQDIFANVSTAAKSAARYTAHQDYIGKNGEVISQLLDDMAQEGVEPDTINKVARQVQDYLDAESGNYKRPTSDAGKLAMRIQKSFMMYTTLAGLPLATVSSLVEAALVSKGLRADQLPLLKNAGKEFSQMMWDGGKEFINLAAHKESKDWSESAGQKKIRDLGFYEWDVGAATVTGVSEVNSAQQSFYQSFFKWNGLSGWTNFTRAARASIAGDYLFDKARTIFEHRLSGDPKTREIQEAEEGLRNIGVDVDQYVDLVNLHGPMSAEQEAFMESQTREATFNFINEAVALPQSANRPLIYQDPRFALFTQFQGFIATFTANHIPKLWGEYVKRGTPAMKYNAFATMMTMIMLGFASQYLKDLIKYGGKTPHLEGADYVQRGVRASGLLGTGERVLDQFFPLYDQRSDGVGGWVFNSSVGESPALGFAKNLGQGAGHVITGEGEKLANNALKATPFNPFRHQLKKNWQWAKEKLDE